ncbi:MAG TPA: CaiB/BaiF CoA-transferase family protein, partial [Acidimicrobiales bacterium]|nr:CaiB/BaiF CoA-transferase family protein [Acidimicrobiales bacterium]
RGRKGVTCDLRRPEGQSIFRRLAERCDVVCENFRPGTMERWGLGPDDLPDHLVYVRVSVFGQTGPYASRPGLDRLGIAFGGLLYLTGYPDRPPVRPGVTVADYLTGVFAATAALASLYERDRGAAVPSGDVVEGGTQTEGRGRRGSPDGRGRVVDAPLYAAILRILEWTLAAHDRLGLVRERTGNRLEHAAPLDNYPTSDGRTVCILGGSDANFARLCRAMDRTDLLDDPRFSTTAARAAHGTEINGIVARWTASLTAAELGERCVAAGVPVGTAYSAADIFEDPHMAAREDLVTVDDPVIGPVRQQAPFPRFVGDVPHVPTGAPLLGQHNDEIWRGVVGLSEDELAALRASGVV